MSQTPLSNDERIDALLTTLSWNEQNGQAINLTYSFPDESSTWVENYGNNEPFPPNEIYFLTPEAQQAVRDALQLWSNVTQINFIEVQEPHTQGEMRFTFSSSIDEDKIIAAYSPSPNGAFFESSGDIWINPELESLDQGSKEFSALIHQIGHALGLKHPDEFIDFNETTLPYKNDTTQYSILSTNPYGMEGDIYLVNEELPENTSLMLYDILAAQFLYGVNTNYNIGNNTYTFDTTAELKTIWDTAGIDTFDLSNQTLGLTINLNEGQFSSIGRLGTMINIAFHTDPDPRESPTVAIDNIAIAYGVEIENVIGGTGNDNLIGNLLANHFTGGAGDDFIEGAGGIDTAYYSDNKQNYTIETTDTTLITHNNSLLDGVDTLHNIERLQFNDTTLALDIEGNAGQAYRLYQAAFNRTPDKKGLGFWINALDQGDTLKQVGFNFISSQEFTVLYGEDVTDNIFLSSLYDNVLHRALDTAGQIFWMNELQTQPRENVLIGFSESEENKLQVIGVIQDGIELSNF